MSASRDQVDDHVERWRRFWTDADGFEAEVEGALTRMEYLVRRTREQAARAFADSELSLEDYNTLHTLLVQPFPVQATPAQLAEAMHITRAAVTNRLGRLAEAGLVTREVDATDRRRVIVRATAKGKSAWEDKVHHGIARQQALFAPLDLEQVRQLNDLLRHLVNGT